MIDRPLNGPPGAVAALASAVAVRARRFLLLVLLALLVPLPPATAWAQERELWTGEWRTYWRDGAAILTLTQEGDRVRGVYEPGSGRVEGRTDGRRLEGTWSQRGASGNFIFALDAEAQVFTGRYESGEYWNGERVAVGRAAPTGSSRNDTPQEALRSLVIIGNRIAYERETRAMREVERLMAFEGGASDSRDERRRRNLMWLVIDLSTFRLRDVPGEVDGDAASFRLGPAGMVPAFEVRFVRERMGWRVLVPEADRLEADVARLLDMLGHASVEEALAARADSPRGVLRRFMLGARDWNGPGRQAALATLDLSYLPAQLYEIQGPVLADYLTRVLDRSGFVIWQEIPDDPGRATPYVHYRHPAGAVVMARGITADGAPGPWQFTDDTLRGAPDLFGAMQDLRVAEGVADRPPLTDFFRLREAVRERAPEFTRRYGLLEVWQWILLGAAVLGAGVLGWGMGRGVTGLLAALESRIGLHLEAESIRRLDWPIRAATAGMAAIFALGWLGLAQTALEEASLAITFLTTLAVGLVLFRIAGLVGGHLRERAEATPTVVDQIFTSLATGLVQMMIVIGAVVALAEVVGLPYEGVLTGLGVGGIALAFAARDTVSNLLSGAILMADRPFRQGDLIETDHGMATVELVGPRSTRMRTFDDALLVLPNAQLTDRGIFNWGRRRKRKILLHIGLTYDTPRERLDVFAARLAEVYGEQETSDPTSGYIGMTGFGASSIDIELWGYFRVFNHPDFVKARHALVGDIVELAKEVGVSFAFPTRVVHVSRATAVEPGSAEPAPEAEARAAG